MFRAPPTLPLLLNSLSTIFTSLLRYQLLCSKNRLLLLWILVICRDFPFGSIHEVRLSASVCHLPLISWFLATHRNFLSAPVIPLIIGLFASSSTPHFFTPQLLSDEGHMYPLGILSSGSLTFSLYFFTS